MPINAKTLTDYTLEGLDGEIGKVKQFYFDDKHWTVRYLVVDTGNWLAERQVLISPYSLGTIDKEKQRIKINLTKQQIENSPPLENDKPVSQQFEEGYHEYFGLPLYSAGPHVWGFSPNIVHDRENRDQSNQGGKPWDPHLRSTSEVSGYHIQSLDDEVGHIDDFLIDEETWAIRYLIVDTRNWLSGIKVLISTRWIERVSWNESKVFVNVPCAAIKEAPEYTDKFMLTRDYETILHIHYNRKVYWTDISGEK